MIAFSKTPRRQYLIDHMRTAGNPRHGFTLLEALILVSLVAVMASVLVPVFSAGQEGFNRAQCAGNLRQIGIAAHVYAQENDNRLPGSPPPWPGSWPSDLAAPLAKDLLETGAVERSDFYCPSAPSDIVAEISDWASYEFPENPNSSAMTTYILFIQAPAVPSQYQNTHLGDHLVQNFRELILVPENQRELAVDAVMSTVSSSFLGIYGALRDPLRTNHMSGDRPTGGNVLFLDGRVAWRDFSEMEERTAGFPNFWW